MTNREQLFNDNVAWATRIARKVHATLPPSFEVDDLIQEALIEMQARTLTYDPAVNDSFQGYAYLYVLNRCRMSVRRRHFKEATSEPLDSTEVSAAVRAQSEDRALTQTEATRARWRESRRRSLIRRKLARLDQTEATLVRLVLLDGESLDTAADATHLSATDVRRILRKAAAKLKGDGRALRPGARQLLRVLEQRQGEVLPVTRLAKLLRCETRTIERRLAKLKARGLIRTRRTVSGNSYAVKEKDNKLSGVSNG